MKVLHLLFCYNGCNLHFPLGKETLQIFSNMFKQVIDYFDHFDTTNTHGWHKDNKKNWNTKNSKKVQDRMGYCLKVHSL